MIWDGIRNPLEGDMPPLAGIPSSLVGYLSELLVWYSIQRPYSSVVLNIRGKNKQRKMSA